MHSLPHNSLHNCAVKGASAQLQKKNTLRTKITELCCELRSESGRVASRTTSCAAAQRLRGGSSQSGRIRSFPRAWQQHVQEKKASETRKIESLLSIFGETAFFLPSAASHLLTRCLESQRSLF
jgi:hypothetical protein